MRPPGAKEAMIVAAERRFALSGIEGASMRQIAMDAGQRNESAAHYHFGSREGLIRAILDHRIAGINARRARRLDIVRAAEGHDISPQSIASIMIHPMAEEIFSHWRECYWIRFISQLFAIEKYQYLALELEGSSPALFDTYALMLDIRGVERAILAVRRHLLARDVVWGLSRIEAMSFHESRPVCELHIANLVDMIAAGIAAAPSAETLRMAQAAGAAARHAKAGEADRGPADSPPRQDRNSCRPPSGAGFP